ncbi:MAG TPA: hypothetical protein VLL97_01310, partial [Acidobacteriota bacterium]|nr:hypothetical protein [Acidobacteriota bacterium]
MESREEDGTITVNLTGQDRPFLLSGSALLLNDIEFLLNRIFGTGTNGNKGIVVDTGDYRHHRKLELKLLAQMASVKVLANKKPLSLQPMAARDRKI